MSHSLLATIIKQPLASIIKQAARPWLVAWSSIAEPSVAGLLARNASVSAVVLDMQHGGHTDTTIVPAIAQVAIANKMAFVRVPVSRLDAASRALDMGATGVIAPMVNTVEDARKLVDFTKFPPMGQRRYV